MYVIILRFKEMKWDAGVIILLISAVGLSNLALIRKEQDPIQDTQTAPIAYKQKMEEIKDGEKGPPTPSYQYYSRSRFLTEQPIAKDVQEELNKPQLGVVSTSAGEDLFVPDADNAIAPDDIPVKGEVQDGESEVEPASEEWWAEEKADNAQPAADNQEKNAAVQVAGTETGNPKEDDWLADEPVSGETEKNSESGENPE
jgi:hypothetical protein